MKRILIARIVEQKEIYLAEFSLENCEVHSIHHRLDSDNRFEKIKNLSEKMQYEI